MPEGFTVTTIPGHITIVGSGLGLHRLRAAVDAAIESGSAAVTGDEPGDVTITVRKVSDWSPA